jgi:FdhD protein
MTKTAASSSPTEPVGESPALRWSEGAGWAGGPERLAVEAPLAIEIAYPRQGRRVQKVLAVTMRTPGADEELALGFLLGEGLIAGLADVVGGTAADENARGETIVTWRVELAAAPREDLERVSRGLITSSACGVCGRSTLEGLPVRRVPAGGLVAAELIARLPELLRQQQPAFAASGGSHGAGLCDESGRLLLAREDVGRHNAVDKLMGAALRSGIASAGKILVLSGRASFELLQKASAAGIAWVVAVGAPSSLAVDLAHAAGITLVGFARGNRFTVYAHADRVVGSAQGGVGERAP